jgi:hypothetical protein
VGRSAGNLGLGSNGQRQEQGGHGEKEWCAAHHDLTVNLIHALAITRLWEWLDR